MSHFPRKLGLAARQFQGTNHQMFGYGTELHNAASDNVDKVMLSQLSSDSGMFWQVADYGVLQFWIDPDDLAAGRVDRVTATTEG